MMAAGGTSTEGEGRVEGQTDGGARLLPVESDAVRIRIRWLRAGAALLYAGLAVAVTRGLILKLDSHLPVGTQPAATVPFFNLWTTWWNADRLAHGLRDYWNAPIFHPTQGTFSFSEAQPTLWCVAPLVWLSAPVAAYNVYLLGSLWLNGWVGAALLRQLGHRESLAVPGGAMFLLLPFVHWQLGVLQLVPLWGILWTLLTLDRLAEQPSARRGACLGLAFATTYLLCNYYGLFLSVLLAAASGWLLAKRALKPRLWGGIAVSLVVAAAITAPVVWAQLEYLLVHRFDRQMVQVQSLATHWSDYLLPWGYNWLGTDRLISIERKWSLSAGHLKTLLALIGVAGGLWARGRRRRTLFWMAFVACAAVLSSAPNISMGDWNLQRNLVQFWPGFAQIRSMMRFAVFAQIGTVVLAVQGLALLLRIAGPKRWLRTAVFLLAAAATVDVWPLSPHLGEVPARTGSGHWATWIGDNTPRDAVLCGIPFPSGTNEEAHEVSTIWMAAQIEHGRAVVNGYSGFFPQTYRALKFKLREFPGPDSLEALREAGVDYCVVAPALRTEDDPTRLDSLDALLERVYEDRVQGVTVFRLKKDPPHPG
jgi:hypothetical protein